MYCLLFTKVLPSWSTLMERVDLLELANKKAEKVQKYPFSDLQSLKLRQMNKLCEALYNDVTENILFSTLNFVTGSKKQKFNLDTFKRICNSIFYTECTMPNCSNNS